MKISSGWIVTYLREFDYCKDIKNPALGLKIKKVLSAMDCVQDPDQVQFPSPVEKASGKAISILGLARKSYHYTIAVGQLPEFFKALEKELGEKIT